jgi:hypothetical protein
MLLPKALVVLGISFPLLALSVPIKCPPGAPCVPDPDSSHIERRSEVPNPYPGPTHPVPPTHPIDQRSAEPEPDAASQPEKRQAKTGTWPYYGYPVPKGPVKIERSAAPIYGPTDPEPGTPHPHYVYSSKTKRSADPDPYPEPPHPHPPTYDYSDAAPAKREAEPNKPGNPLPPHYLYQDTQRRSTDDYEAPKASETPTADANAGTPYYGYPARAKREAAAEPEPTIYRVPGSDY